MLCDADGDLDVDLNDIQAIVNAKGTPSSGSTGIPDMDGDGTITVLDARQCVDKCDETQCADPSANPPPEITIFAPADGAIVTVGIGGGEGRVFVLVGASDADGWKA